MNNDSGSSVRQTADGGYILLGSTDSKGAGKFDFYLLKTDNTGNILWEKTFGGSNIDVGRSIQPCTDGGYILLGDTGSEGAGNADFYLLKTDKEGNIQ